MVGRQVTAMEAQQRLQQVVDAVCAQGCARVRDCIRALQAAETLPVYAHLDSPQRDALLQELQAIMKVYDKQC